MSTNSGEDARRRRFDAIAIVITLLSVVVTVAFMNGGALGITAIVDADAEAHSDDAYFTSNDLDGNWSTDGATTIALDGTTASVSGGGAYVWGGNVTIANPGTYVVSGSLDGGCITVDANSNSKVWVMLDGVSITNNEGACLVVNEADKVFLTLADGSTNTLASGSSYSDEALAEGMDGAIFARDDLTINGDGTLGVTAGYKHGIVGNDDLVITGGDITVEAAGDAIHANDSLRICEASLTLTAGDDGLAVDNEGGYLYVRSGSIDISATDEGMVALGNVIVDGGDVSIACSTEQGHHGVKAGDTCTVAGGTITVSECYEGITAPHIDVSGGDVTVYPADDGLNASNGGGLGGGMGMMGGGARGEIDAGATADGAEAGGMRGGFTGGGMGVGFGELAGVTVDGGSVAITAEGAQNIIAAAEARGLAVSATVDDLVACTTLDELMAALGIDTAAMGGGRGMAGGRRGGMSVGDGPVGAADATAQATGDAVSAGGSQAPGDVGAPPAMGDGGDAPNMGGQVGATGDGSAPAGGGFGMGAPPNVGGAAPGEGGATSGEGASGGDVSVGTNGEAGNAPADGTATDAPAGTGMSPDAGGDAASSNGADIPWIHVSGGNITVVNDSGRDADGLDSNGDIVITGGDIRVSLLGDGSNSAIDYGSESGGTCAISGGTVVACGGSSMAEGFDSTSTQCSLLYNFSSGAAAGTTVSLVDASGNVLLSYEAPCSFTSVNLSCPEMELGGTYAVVIGDMSEEVTLSEVALSSGDVQSSMFGGGFVAGGGMRGAGGFGGARGMRGGDVAANGAASADGQRQPADGAQATLGEGGATTGSDTEGAGDRFVPMGEPPSGGGQAPMPPEGMGQGMGMPEDVTSSVDGNVAATDANSTVDARSGSNGSTTSEAQGGRSGDTPSMRGGGAASSDAEAYASASVDATVDDASMAKAYTTETLVLCGASVVVLAAGLVAALLFRRH